jgi:hypothetical protein
MQQDPFTTDDGWLRCVHPSVHLKELQQIDAVNRIERICLASDSAMAVSLIASAFPDRTEYNRMDRSGYEPTQSTKQHTRATNRRWIKYIEFRRKDINFGGTWNGRTFDIKGFDSDEAVEIPLGNTGELSGQCANGIA